MAPGADTYRFIAEFYDAVPAYASRPDIAFYVAEAQRGAGPVLELGCGTGRVLLEVARAGLSITGLDLSPAMLDRCRARVAREPAAVRERVRLVEHSFVDFDLGQRFATVTMPFRPFQHLLDPAAQLSCLAAIARHLEPAGRLVLDLFNPKLEALAEPTPVGPYADGEPFRLPDGAVVQRLARIPQRDLFRQVQRVELIHEVQWPEGTSERCVDAFDLRWTYRWELEHLLVRGGYAIEALYGGFDRSPYGAVWPGELIVVARRG